MSAELLERYRTLMNELLIVREAEGGGLPVETESAYVERLDAIWWRLSEEQQHAYEGELANPITPLSSIELNLVDCKVNEGERIAPRTAA